MASPGPREPGAPGLAGGPLPVVVVVVPVVVLSSLSVVVVRRPPSLWQRRCVSQGAACQGPWALAPGGQWQAHASCNPPLGPLGLGWGIAVVGATGFRGPGGPWRPLGFSGWAIRCDNHWSPIGSGSRIPPAALLGRREGGWTNGIHWWGSRAGVAHPVPERPLSLRD